MSSMIRPLDSRMTMLKKLLTRGLLLMVAVLFADAASAEMPADPLVVGFLTGASGLGDDAFSDMAYAGLREAQQKYGFQVIIKRPGETGQATEATVVQLVKASDVIILLGAQHASLADRLADAHPEKLFIQVSDPLQPRPNVASLVFKEQEGAFLAGVLSAWMTRTDEVGFIGGTDYDVIHVFRIGFLEGVKYVSTGVRVREAFVQPGHDCRGFVSPGKAFAIADGWYRDDVDIIFAVASGSNKGIIRAAQVNGRFAIGVDTDQDFMAKGNVLTSMMKRLDKALCRELAAIMEGRFQSGVKVYGLNEGGVSLSPMRYTRHLIPGRVLDDLAEVEAKILSGEIVV